VFEKKLNNAYIAAMETPNNNEQAAADKKVNPAPDAKKAAPKKLPSKQISFSSQPTSKKGKQGGKTMINTNKKGGVNLMKKLSGM